MLSINDWKSIETLANVSAKQDPSEGFVQNYCLLIGDKSFSNFQKVSIDTDTTMLGVDLMIYLPQILDLKGTPRADQQKLLDIFLSVTSSMDDLSDTSFLTGLDMDVDSATAKAGSNGSSAVTDRVNMMSPTSTSLPALLRSQDPSRSGTPAGRGGSEANTPFGDFKRLVSFAMRDM